MAHTDPLLHYPLRVACQATTRADAERTRAERCRLLYERASALQAHYDPAVRELATLAAHLAAEAGGHSAAATTEHQQAANLAVALLTHAEQVEARLQRLERPWWMRWFSRAETAGR